MADVPDTIWAMASMDGKWSDGHCTNVQPQVNDITAPFIFEYTRTDISQARIAQLEAAVEWYGEQVYLFANDTTGKADEADVALDQDGGKRARAALKAKP
jgi:hypothetical protein